MFEGVVGIDEELVEAGDVGCAGDLGDDGRIRAKCHFLYRLAGEGCAQNAFYDERFAQGQFAAGDVQGGAGADAGSGGAAVYFAVGKDADVAAVVGGVMCWADEDDAVEEAQIGGEGVADGQTGHHSLLDARTGVNQLAEVGRGQADASFIGLDEGVECAAKGHVVTDEAQTGHIYLLIQGVGEGGDVVEGDGGGTAVFPVRGGGDAAGGGINLKGGGGAGLINQAGI